MSFGVKNCTKCQDWRTNFYYKIVSIFPHPGLNVVTLVKGIRYIYASDNITFSRQDS